MSRRAKAGRPPRQTPYKRTYPSGRTAWIARYYDLDGKTRYAKPRWNGGKSAFARKVDAQRAIDEALDRLYGIGTELAPERIGDYYEVWLRRHPRSARTDKTNTDRVSYVLDVEIEGRALGDWEFDELRRRQALALLDHMLRAEGRAAEGARGILRALSAMAEDAIGDDVAAHNAFIGIRLRGNDPGSERRRASRGSGPSSRCAPSPSAGAPRCGRRHRSPPTPAPVAAMRPRSASTRPTTSRR